MLGDLFDATVEFGARIEIRARVKAASIQIYIAGWHIRDLIHCTHRVNFDGSGLGLE